MKLATWTAGGYSAQVKVVRHHPNSPGIVEVEGVFGRAWAREQDLAYF